MAQCHDTHQMKNKWFGIKDCQLIYNPKGLILHSAYLNFFFKQYNQTIKNKEARSWRTLTDPKGKNAPNHSAFSQARRREGSLDGEQLSPVLLTKAEWPMLLAIRLYESHAWVPPKSRQVEKFPLDVVLCPYGSSENRARLEGWVDCILPVCSRALVDSLQAAEGHCSGQMAKTGRVFNWYTQPEGKYRRHGIGSARV